jgi:hypothetical protein
MPSTNRTCLSAAATAGRQQHPRTLVNGSGVGCIASDPVLANTDFKVDMVIRLIVGGGAAAPPVLQCNHVTDFICFEK